MHLGLVFRLDDGAAIVKTAARAGRVVQLWGAAVRAGAERRLLELIVRPALIAARPGISVCWIWHGVPLKIVADSRSFIYFLRRANVR